VEKQLLGTVKRPIDMDSETQSKVSKAADIAQHLKVNGVTYT